MKEKNIKIIRKNYRDFTDFCWPFRQKVIFNQKEAVAILLQIKDEIIKFAQKYNLESWPFPSNDNPREWELRWEEKEQTYLGEVKKLVKVIELLPIIEEREILLSVDAIKSIPNPSGPSGTVSLSKIPMVLVEVNDVEALQKALKELYLVAKKIKDKDVYYLHRHLYGPGFPSR